MKSQMSDQCSHAIHSCKELYLRQFEMYAVIPLTMKSPVVIMSTLVSSTFRISLNTRPISVFDTLDTAQISETNQ